MSKQSSIIRVDRSIKPVYPDTAWYSIHPELQNTGPAEFDVEKLELCFHPKQIEEGWVVQLPKIYNHIKESGLLGYCLGLRDLEEIQKKEIVFFRQHWEDKKVFGWKSIVGVQFYRDRLVPLLFESDEKVVLSWANLGNFLHYGPSSEDNLAPYFPK